MKKKAINTGISYYDNMLNSPLDRFTKNKETIEISTGYIPDDVLERIDGYELGDNDKQYAKFSRRQTFSSILTFMTIFATAILKKILIDPEDDTNETTKYRIELLYNKIKRFKYFIIVR